jgi:hypothetical protein
LAAIKQAAAAGLLVSQLFEVAFDLLVFPLRRLRMVL